MKPQDVVPVRPLKLGRYALLGMMVLALSLGGVLGGHQLLGAAFGPGDPDETNAVPSAEAAECPAALQAADACDEEKDVTPPDGEADGCHGVHEDEAAAGVQRRDAADAPGAGG